MMLQRRLTVVGVMRRWCACKQPDLFGAHPDDSRVDPSPHLVKILVIYYIVVGAADIIFSVLSKVNQRRLRPHQRHLRVPIEFLFAQPDNFPVLPLPNVIKILVEDFVASSWTVIWDTVEHKAQFACDE